MGICEIIDMSETKKDIFSVVIVGHVDHGKSTVIGRLMADSGGLPDGKLEEVRELCRRTAKPFEYAFLLDALKDERAQGITIDTARCFFETDLRRYIIIDAPGHIEFLKNMITGAARADAAFVVIDAKEGIKENSKRHGYMVGMMGVRQVSVLVNKMDLIDYDKAAYDELCDEYRSFLERVNITPVSFIPVSGISGDNIAETGDNTPWYTGSTVLEQIDQFEKKDERIGLPFRLPLQDVYRFTEQGDDRRIFAGTVTSGSLSEGEEVTFLPSGKKSRVKSVEAFNADKTTSVSAEESIGLTLETQIYVKPGELIVKSDDKPPCVGNRFRANLFWMGRNPMLKGKRYKLKIGSARTTVELVEVLNTIDASELTSVKNKQQVDRHDVTECVLETIRPVAFDLVGELPFTGRVVIVDDYEIAGAGIILEQVDAEQSILQEHVNKRELSWGSSDISAAERMVAYGHGAKFVVVTGESTTLVNETADRLEKTLFDRKFNAYCLHLGNVAGGLDADIINEEGLTDEHVRRLGELARILTDSGQIFITSAANLDDYDIETLRVLNSPNEIIVVTVGGSQFAKIIPDCELDSEDDVDARADTVVALLKDRRVIHDYQI